MTFKPQAVVFDFDFTLADSAEPIVECANYAFQNMGLPTPEPEAIHKTVGLHLEEAFVQLAGNSHAGRSKEFFDLFVKRADEVMVDMTHLYDTAAAAIGALATMGMPLGIVSTKYRFRIEAILERDGLRDPFGVIVGGEDVAEPKPDPSGLNMAIEKLGGSSDTTLFVGDSLTDAETAKRAGVPFAAVLSGPTLAFEFNGYEPIAVLDDLTGLPALVGGR